MSNMRKALPLILIICVATLACGAARPAKSRSAADYLREAREAAADYRPADARELYDAYEKQLRRSRKSVPEEVEAERAALINIENMLERVESIVVFDSLTVDSATFFTHYRLSPEAGRLLPGTAVRIPAAPMAFVPQSNTELLYALPDSAGEFVLMGADILDDGTLDHPAPLDIDTDGGSARFPFLMADGVTLYFAHNGESSIGGYDIFMTRRDDDGSFLQPQNVGMPYNSTANDYLLAIDEASGIGWWATDRFAPQGQVTIYIFRPSATRVNVSPDNPALTALARLTDISLTWEPGADYSALRRKVQQVGATAPAAADNTSFDLAVGNKIFNSLGDFRSPDARRAMARAIDARAAIAAAQSRLNDLREKFRRGDRSVEAQILNLEMKIVDSREAYREAVNDALTAEANAR